MALVNSTGYVQVFFPRFSTLADLFQRRAIEGALLAASRRTDLIAQCDQVLSVVDGSAMPQEGTYVRSILTCINVLT